MSTTVTTQLRQTNATDISNELNFGKNLQTVINKINAANDIDEIMLEVSKDICTLFNADRLTVYALSDDKSFFTSRVKTGFDSFQDLRLPVTENSIVGFAGLQKQIVNIEDVYNKSELKKINPMLVFSHEVDKRTGYRTKQMAVAPILNADNQELLGVVQAINNRNNQSFPAATAVEGMIEICKTLAVVFKQRQKPIQLLKSKYDHLISDAVISAAEFELATRSSRKKGIDLEDVLLDEFQIGLPLIGKALSAFFEVRYEPFRTDRIRPMDLLKNLKKDYVESNSLLPIDEIKEGLVVLTLDPERVKTNQSNACLFA